MRVLNLLFLQMKRAWIVILVVFICLSVTPVFSISKKDFDRVVDFNATIDSLSVALEKNLSVDREKIYVLNGTVSSVTIVNRKRANYEVILEVVSGKWVGLEKIEVYKVMVRFKGPQYYGVILTRKPRRASHPVIVPNTKVLFVGKIVGQTKPINFADSSDKAWLFEGFYIRAID